MKAAEWFTAVALYSEFMENLDKIVKNWTADELQCVSEVWLLLKEKLLIYLFMIQQSNPHLWSRALGNEQNITDGI